MHQEAPYPEELADLVSRISYKPGWEFELADMPRHAGAFGLTLSITAITIDSDPPHKVYTVKHYFWVPAESYDYNSWSRWLLEQVFKVEHHEAMEFFRIDNDRPYAPGHGGGNNPYYAIPA